MRREQVGKRYASSLHGPSQDFSIDAVRCADARPADGLTAEDARTRYLGPAREPDTTRYHYDSFDMLVRIERHKPELPPWLVRLEPADADDDDAQSPAAQLRAWAAEYDALGRRLLTRWTTNDGAQKTRRFYWDGDRLAAELLPDGQLRIYEYASLHALVPLAFTDYPSVDAPPSSGRTYHVFTNPVGIPLAIEDPNGNLVWSPRRIDPYGLVELRPGSSLEYNLRWPGHYFDPETGLHYNRYRYYDPKLGRYLQSDPIGHEGSPINLYAYCPNPLVQVDVLGLAHPDKADNDAGGEGHENDGREGVTKGDANTPKSDLDNALDVLYAKAERTKKEIDQLATRVAEQHNGKVAMAPLKSRERARQKIETAYKGDASRIKDLARNTIVVPKGQERAALDTLLRENPNIRPEHVKIVDPESDPLGYSGINVTVPAESGHPGEIQINSSEMIYAKEHPSNSRSILGESTFNDLASRPDLPPGGQGHGMYEEWRVLPEDSERAQEVATQSREYYNAFRR